MEKIQHNRFSKVLVLLMAVMMVLTMMPNGMGGAAETAWAAEEISITFTYAKDNALVYGPIELKVHAGQAAEYGIGTASSSPTVLDAVVAAHKAKYGADFTAESAEDYVNDTLGKLFQETGYGGHILNGHYSPDYAPQAELKNGDVVDTFLYHNTYDDNYVAFYEDENIVREIQTTTSDMIELTAKSFNVMNAYGGETWEIRPALSLGTTDGNGNFTSKGIATDETGKATLSFDTEGTYILTANGGSTSIVPPWCKITVLKGMTEEEQKQCVANDKAALNVTYTDGDSVNLSTTGESGKTSIIWTSSNEQVVTPKGAVIKMPNAESVTLTATIKCGSATETKEFVLSIPALDEAGITERLEKGKRALLQVNALDPVEYTGLSGGGYPYESEIKDTNIVTKAQELVTAAAPGVTVSIVEVASGTEYIESNGGIVYASKDGTAEVKFKLSLGNHSDDVSVVGIKVPKHKESKTEAVKKLMDETTEEVVLNGQNAKEVKSTLKMPVGSTLGLVITWTSDNAAIEITRGANSSTGQLHKITRPALGEENAVVTLTATFDYSDTAKRIEFCDGGPMPANNTKTFTVTVPALTQDEVAAITEEVKAAVDSVPESGITAYDAAGKTDSKIPADLTGVITDLHLYDFDSKNEYRKNGIRLSWTSTNAAITVNTLRAKITRPIGSENATGKLTVTASKEGITASKSFDVVVLSTEAAALNADARIAIEKITDRYAKQSNAWWGDASYSTGTWWQIVAMGAYREKYNKDKLNDQQKQAIVDKTIASLANDIAKIGSSEATESSTINAIGNGVNLLSALGYDVENLTTINRSKLKAGSALKKMNLEGAKKGYFSTIAPYALIALQQGNYGSKVTEDSLISYLLSLQNSGGGWGYSGRFDVDTTAMILQGLATQRSNPEVEKAVQAGISKLAQSYAAKTKNTYGNANSDAVVILALAACGIDPSRDIRFMKNGASLVDGMLTYLNAKKDAFKLGARDNEMATQQAVLALIAADKICGTNTAVNIFDFKTTEKIPAVAASTGSITTPSTPTGDDITVKMSIQSDTGEFWMQNQSVTVPGDGATVYHAFTKACDAAGITYAGAENGYVRSMTKAGKTLAEFTNGKNSGWLYKVNNILPDVGLTNYSIKDGDSILWYYTNDWTKDPDAGKHFPSTDTKSDVTTSGASGSAITTAPTDVKVSEKTNADGTKETVAAVKVDSKHHDEIIKQAAENKSAEIVLEVSQTDSKGADNVQLTLDVVFVKNVADKTNADLTVNTENGKVTLNREALKTVLGAAKGTTLTLEVSKVAQPTEAQKKAAGANAYLFKLIVKSGGKSISDFNKGSAQVRLALPSALLDKKTAAIHIAEDGTIEQFAGKVLTIAGKKYYEFTTPHFSTFALVDADEAGLDVVDEQTADAKALTAKLTPIARSAKTAKKNFKVKLSLDKQDKEILNQLADAGYTVRYRFYRSTKKAAGYKAAVTKKTMTYTNTTGKQGTKYFYKVQIRVYDKNGKLAAKTALKQCRYACRSWTK